MSSLKSSHSMPDPKTPKHIHSLFSSLLTWHLHEHWAHKIHGGTHYINCFKSQNDIIIQLIHSTMISPPIIHKMKTSCIMCMDISYAFPWTWGPQDLVGSDFPWWGPSQWMIQSPQCRHHHYHHLGGPYIWLLIWWAPLTPKKKKKNPELQHAPIIM